MLKFSIGLTVGILMTSGLAEAAGDPACNGKPTGAVCGPATECLAAPTCNNAGRCVTNPSSTNGNPCSSDNNACTTDVCNGGTCHHKAVANDCGASTCGSSPSGCFSCGSCAGGSVCDNGACAVVDPCAGVVCGQCLKCSGGVCVADSASNGSGCIGESSGLCFLSTCSEGTCSTVGGDFDGTPPTITCSPDQTLECIAGGATATVSADATDQCSTPTNTCANASPQTFPLGTTASTCTAVDGAGDTASCASNVAVQDTTLPIIACVASQTVTTSSQGGACSASLAVSATASDLCWGSLAAVCSPSTLSLSAPGTAGSTCSATDGSGQGVSCSTSLTLVDDTAPVINGPAAGSTQYILGDCTGGAIPLGVTATDTCETVTPTCTTVTGNSWGVNTVSCTATDSSGNTSSLSYSLVVLEPLRIAFTSPLSDDNKADDHRTDADAVNRFTSGSTIPHKVTLNDCSGVDVTRSAGVTVKLDVQERSGSSDATSTLVNDLPELFNGTGDAGGLLVLTDGKYHFNASTAGWTKGTVNTSNYFQSTISVRYNSAPGVVAGVEDARLESR